MNIETFPLAGRTSARSRPVVALEAVGADSPSTAGPDTQSPAAVSPASAVPAGAQVFTTRVGQFASDAGGTYLLRPNKAGDEAATPICNFTATIVQDRKIDEGDGASRRTFKIAAVLADGRRRTVDVSATDFDRLGWVAPMLGASAIIYPNMAPYLPSAIRELSEAITPIPEQTALGHVGYSEPIDADAIYVTGDAILCGLGQDISGLITDLPAAVENFALPDAAVVATARAAALAASARVLAFGPLAVMLPLWLHTYRAALPILPPDFAVWLEGKTGTFKSATAGVLQSHYGPKWSGTNLPGTWSSTKTALEGVMHGAKNALCVIDDYKSDGTHQQQRALEAIAGSLVRGVGNRSARGRSTADLKERPIREPRGAVLVTAEGPPSGHSVVARCLVVNMDGTKIDRQRSRKSTRSSGRPAGDGRYPHALLRGRWCGPAVRRAIRDRAANGDCNRARAGDAGRRPGADVRPGVLRTDLNGKGPYC
jgi:hypothetical protein